MKFSSSKPLLCLEVNPPRGTDTEASFAKLANSLKGVDFFNVTDSALAKMRMAPFPFASILKRRFGIEPLVNLSCRDRNVIALQADLLGAWAMGVQSVVALTGDAVTVGDNPGAKGVFEMNSVGLLNLIAKLNSGYDSIGNSLKGAPSFVSGVVVNPNVKNASAELKRLRRKYESGAKYALSQPVYDLNSSAEFFAQAKEIGVPIFLGLLPLKNVGSIQAVSKIPGIRVSGDIMKYANDPADMDISNLCIEYCLKLAEHNRKSVCGFHVISGATPSLALKLTSQLAAYIANLL